MNIMLCRNKRTKVKSSRADGSTGTGTFAKIKDLKNGSHNNSNGTAGEQL